MMGRNHVATGVLTGSGVAWLAQMNPGQAAAFIGITSACALLPDFDHPNAIGPRYLGWPGRVLAWAIHMMFGHRGLTHSVLGVAVLSAGMAFIPHLPAFCYWAVILGCATHIAGDMCTVSGVPLFWPLDRSFRVGVMRTGHFFETEILTPVLAVVSTLTGAGTLFLLAREYINVR
jgi:inner membrane protein